MHFKKGGCFEESKYKTCLSYFYTFVYFIFLCGFICRFDAFSEKLQYRCLILSSTSPPSPTSPASMTEVNCKWAWKQLWGGDAPKSKGWPHSPTEPTKQECDLDSPTWFDEHFDCMTCHRQCWGVEVVVVLGGVRSTKWVLKGSSCQAGNVSLISTLSVWWGRAAGVGSASSGVSPTPSQGQSHPAVLGSRTFPNDRRIVLQHWRRLLEGMLSMSDCISGNPVSGPSLLEDSQPWYQTEVFWGIYLPHRPH